MKGTVPALYLMTEAEPVSETPYLETLKKMNNAIDNFTVIYEPTL
jgi:hypothetical protein